MKSIYSDPKEFINNLNIVVSSTEDISSFLKEYDSKEVKEILRRGAQQFIEENKL